MTYSQQWELESIYPGGASSPKLKEEIKPAEQRIAELRELLKQANAASYESLVKQTEIVEEVLATLREADSYTACLMAQNMFDKEAVLLNDRLKNLSAVYTSALTEFDHHLDSIEQKEWVRLLSQPALAVVAYNLNEQIGRASCRERVTN